MNNLTASEPIANPDRLAQRLIQQAHLSDGLPELSIGFSLLLASGISWAYGVMVPRTLPFRVLLLLSSFAFSAICLTAGILIKWVRNRWLLRRFGYMARSQRRPDRKHLAAAVLGAAIIALLSGGPLLYLHLPDRIPLVLTGLPLGIFVAVIGRRPRFLSFGIFAVAATLLLACSPLSTDLSMALLLTLDGAFLLVSGAIVLALFLRRPVEEGD
jgi:hypothetical protein